MSKTTNIKSKAIGLKNGIKESDRLYEKAKQVS